VTDRDALAPESWIGRPELRREDQRLVCGEGRFVDTVALPDTVHLAFVRSPLAHARVHGLDRRQASALPGVVAILSAEDLGDRRPSQSTHRGRRNRPVVPAARQRAAVRGRSVAAVLAGRIAGTQSSFQARLEPLPSVRRRMRPARRGRARRCSDNVLVRWRQTPGVSASFDARSG
jgi:carbon-monoxide dehydrogenase large subunit